jgi:hypothetical protein
MHLLRLTFRFQLSSEKTICVSPFVSTSNRLCEFQERNQNFICIYNETRSIAMRVIDRLSLFGNRGSTPEGRPWQRPRARVRLGGAPPFRTIRLAVVTPSFSFRLRQLIWLCLALQEDRPLAVYSRTAGIWKPRCRSLSASRPFFSGTGASQSS